jgi:Tfp pilus assembly protein PilF
LKLNPDSAVAHNNLARLYHTQGQLDSAIEHYNLALQIDPRLAIAHNNLGILLLQKGNLVEGQQQLREALRLKPGNAETEFNLALTLSQQGQWSEAAELFKETLADHSSDAKAHYEFAVTLFHLKQTREAMGEYAAALLILPDYPDALDGLAWVLSTDANAGFRNGNQAVAMAERACALTGRNDPLKLKTLAAAYAETGRFGEAITTVRAANDLAVNANRQEVTTECELMLENFQHDKSWRAQ